MIKKTEKTERMLQTLREKFSDRDYQEYILGDVRMKDIYIKYECNQNALDYFFAERGYIKRGNLRKSKIRKNIFDAIDTPEAAYILGFYVADGCIYGNKFKITLTESDKEILEKIRDYMSPVTKLNFHKERVNKAGVTTHPMYTFSFACNEIVSRLEELGLGTQKTYLQKSIKSIIPKEFMWDFIRGYWDGDGNINTSEVTKKSCLKGRNSTVYRYTNIGFTIISKDRNILDELNEFFLENNINTHVYPDGKGNYLVGTHSWSEVEKIYKNLYTSSSLFLNRKRIKFDEIMKIPR